MHFHSSHDQILMIRFSLRDCALLALDYQWVWIFCHHFKPSHCPTVCRCKCVHPLRDIRFTTSTTSHILGIVLLVVAHYSDKMKLRWPFIFANLATCAVGFGINISNAPAGVKYFGTFLCVIGPYSAVPGLVAW